ncbi:heme utilization cystosolic carrier protein HutX [Corallincola holothuriorum]|uniref:Heme utilization cystosolic carrier protein HutX n=1 Tax=Corallincola holothuriorum TaxID=2282215 RepID=A0A368N7N6_9GAMM|nr:heme utilization cystosolic carrier protein HutX [Corallincola holothuriorum]RCU45611.1 heme utilization cystosolic carrier protein HutX [Corallincola holothuriorum]
MITASIDNIEHPESLPGEQAQALLTLLSQWRNTTTIIIVAGCVFEFKGTFPPGELGHGYFNLNGELPGLHGHLKLQAIQNIRLMAKQHRGMDSYAFVFEDRKGGTIFKIYLGRDANGTIHPEQLTAFLDMKRTGKLPELATGSTAPVEKIAEG